LAITKKVITGKLLVGIIFGLCNLSDSAIHAAGKKVPEFSTAAGCQQEDIISDKPLLSL
jgi:hypothetical protein